MNARLLLLAAAAIWVRTHADISIGWEPLPCCVGDIAVGTNGAVWAVGKSSPGLNGDVYQWDGITWVKEPGLHGTAIAVDAAGRPWIVNARGDIFRPSGDTWERVPVGRASDIAIGADGSIWITGYVLQADVLQDADVYQWVGSTWVKEANVKGVRIGVAPTGEPTVVNTAGEMFQRTTNTWAMITSQAADVGFGADGSAWITGAPPDGTDHPVSRFSGTTGETASGAQGTRIAVAPNGEPWLVDSAGTVFIGHTGPPPVPVIDASAIVVTPSGVSVTVSTVSGATYNLESKDTVDAALWRAADSQAGTGAPLILHDGQAPGAQGFYRVQATRP